MNPTTATNYWKPSRTAVFWVAAFSVFFYFATQFSTPAVIGQDDGHFHIQFSRQLLERGLFYQFPTLRFTTWSDHFRDHQFLFHILYVPFALIPDLVIGAKIAAAFFASLASLFFLRILLSLGIRYWWFWMILFWSSSEGFLFRMQMPRVQSLALVLLLLTVVALMENRKKLLFASGLLFVWLYDGFFLLFPLMFVWLVNSKWTFKKWRAASLLPILFGILAGMILNPYFPGNFESYFVNFGRILLHPFAASPIPAEWHPPSLTRLIAENWVLAFFKLALMVLNVGPKKSAETNQEKLLGITALFFLVMLLFARRFIEYFPPFLILYFAVAFRDIWPAVSKEWKNVILVSSLGIALAAGAMNTWEFIRSNQPTKEYGCYLRAGAWLSKNVSPGETVFSADWDDFPILYMKAPKLRFVVGLDPRFMKEKDEKLYELYKDVTQGNIKGPYAPIITGIFDSHYVFSDSWHTEFLDGFDKEPDVFRVFNEPYCRIYRIR